MTVAPATNVTTGLPLKIESEITLEATAGKVFDVSDPVSCLNEIRGEWVAK